MVLISLLKCLFRHIRPTKLVRAHFVLFSFIIITGVLLLRFIKERPRSFASTWDVHFGKRMDLPRRYCYVENSSTIVFLHLSDETDRWMDLEMCAIKSAAVMNPDSGVCVLTRFPMREHPQLVGLHNLEIAQLDMVGIFNNTPLRDWFRVHAKTHWTGDYFLWHLSDALRFVYLHKHGGKYLDTVCLTLRNLSSLKNVAGYEESQRIGTDVLIFEKGHPFLKEVLESFINNFLPHVWGSGGPTLITKVHSSGRVDKSTYTILPTDAFSPIYYYTHYLLPFSSDHLNDTKHLTKNSYTLHLWRQWMKLEKAADLYISPPNGSYVYQFLNKVCLVK